MTVFWRLAGSVWGCNNGLRVSKLGLHRGCPAAVFDLAMQVEFWPVFVLSVEGWGTVWDMPVFWNRFGISQAVGCLAGLDTPDPLGARESGARFPSNLIPCQRSW
jgi:hypothetical protein